MKDKQQTPIIQIKFWITVALTAFYLCAVIAIASVKDVFNLSANELGDFFAGAFSPLAFGWFLYAVFMQNAELTETRRVTEMQAEQLSLQRQELEGSKKALEEQSHALNRQNFENTFFNLIKSLSDIIDGIVVEKNTQNDSKVKNGHHALLYIYNNPPLGFWQNVGDNDKSEEIEKYYNTFYDQNSDKIRNYFTMIERIIIFIDKYPILNQEEKNHFIEILNSHLSDAELGLLLIISYSERGKFIEKYIRKYNLLEGFIPETCHQNAILTPHARKLGATLPT